MRPLQLLSGPAWVLSGLALLAGCQGLRPPPVEASPYACPDGRQVQAGLTPDRRRLVLVIDGGRHTLGRLTDGSGYGNGYYSARLDDLFLHLGTAGTLLPQHCRLQSPGAAAAGGR